LATRTTNGSAATVCPVSRSQGVPAMPGVVLPFVPKAVDLPSAIAAANQTAQQLQALAGPVTNNLFPVGGIPSPAQHNAIDGVLNVSTRWVEKSRQTADIRFYATNPDGSFDENQWIDVRRIIYIKWHDKVQGVDFIVQWKYDRQLERGTKLLKLNGNAVDATDPRTYASPFINMD
jgi:hypothetical protein